MKENSNIKSICGFQRLQTRRWTFNVKMRAVTQRFGNLFMQQFEGATVQYITAGSVCKCTQNNETITPSGGKKKHVKPTRTAVFQSASFCSAFLTFL